jgi:hypothetical protein
MAGRPDQILHPALSAQTHPGPPFAGLSSEKVRHVVNLALRGHLLADATVLMVFLMVLLEIYGQLRNPIKGLKLSLIIEWE